jgi:hypothetical protein
MDNALSSPVVAIHFVILAPDASIAFVLPLSAVLLRLWNYFFAFFKTLYIYNTYGGYTYYFRN